ncbi:MAG: cytochrome C oxidase subunit II, partial [Actinobacteria bacterium]|nr:cytochrome C oxidase subunit II [Actinomycetota bacterium]NIU70414.1 cytochrome C oxidase subunit II [Actinomycetota bacterium]NIW32304.1 cytochrome C oxidase subunit II [Actinomycetota bacterium]NIX24512.1 cytochrome C oxidase subunit II [Actinomycetota bacterium]
MITMGSPLEEPEGNWWNEKVNRRETLWMGLSTVWAAILFGWMAGWSRLG